MGRSIGVALLRRTDKIHLGRLVYRAIDKDVVPQEVELEVGSLDVADLPELISIEMWDIG